MNNKDILSLQDFKRRNSYEVYTNLMGKNPSIGKAILSPLREEKHPSFSVFKDEKTGEYLFKDHGSDESGDCIRFVELIRKCDFKTVIELLQQEYNCTISDESKLQPTLINNEKPTSPPTPKTALKSFQIKPRYKFNQQEADYFRQYQIKPEILKKYSVLVLDSYTLSNGTTINRKVSELIFCYNHITWAKIYKPLDSNRKYRFIHLGNKSLDFIFGYDQLPESGFQLIITGGEKDVLTLSSLGYNAISLNSETSSLSQRIADELITRFKEIVVLYDIDETGLKSSEKLCKAFGFRQAILPDTILAKNGKDISDFIKLGHSPENLSEVFSKSVIFEKQKVPSLLIVQSANKWIEDSQNLPIPRMLFDCFWFEGEICILFADTNLGKSILAVQIGDSITKGKSIFPFGFEATKQPVLYFDFELSQKQFEGRYSDNYESHYFFDPNFYRAEIDPDSNIPSQFKDFESFLIYDIEQKIIELGVRILIIDNITYLRADNEKARNALPLMQELKIMKKKHNLSILVLAHTPKRDLTKPLSKNDLQGSKMLINFCDSSIAIGESSQDKNIRYLKHIKTRNTEAKYDKDNVCICLINKETNFLSFEFQNYGREKDHLKIMTDSQTSELDTNIIELKKSNPSLSNREIATQLNTNHSRVGRVLKKVDQMEQMEQGVPDDPDVPIEIINIFKKSEKSGQVLNGDRADL